MKPITLFLTTLVLACVLAACGVFGPVNGEKPAPSAAQQAINSTTFSYNALDAAIVQADAAVKAGTLKGQDARNVVKGLTDAKTALDPVLIALRSANAAAVAAAAASTPASGAKP